MPNDSEEIIRLNVDVPKKLHDAITKVVPWGVKGKLVRSLLRLLAITAGKHGYSIVAAVLEGRAELVITNVHNTDTTAEDK